MLRDLRQTYQAFFGHQQSRNDMFKSNLVILIMSIPGLGNINDSTCYLAAII